MMYSTNVAPAVYYTGEQCRGLRKADLNGINRRLTRGDTLTWGVDYYALFGLSSFYFPMSFFQRYGQEIAGGKVLTFKVYWNGREIIYAPY